jgi:hypothetical protein
MIAIGKQSFGTLMGELWFILIRREFYSTCFILFACRTSQAPTSLLFAGVSVLRRSRIARGILLMM